MREKVTTKPRTSEIDIRIGETIKKIRVLKGYTQNDVAKEIDVTFQQVQKYERGINRISASRLYALSIALGVDIREFFIGLDQQNICSRSSAVTSSDERTLKLLNKFKNIKNPKVKNLIIHLLKES